MNVFITEFHSVPKLLTFDYGCTVPLDPVLFVLKGHLQCRYHFYILEIEHSTKYFLDASALNGQLLLSRNSSRLILHF